MHNQNNSVLYKNMENSNSKISIVGAIILAGLLISGAIIYTKKPATPDGQSAKVVQKEQPAQPETQTPSSQLRLPDSTDHLMGSPNAEITIVLYSDIECPYCKQFHTTMKKVMDTYGKDGKVNWVYRHLPIKSLHPSAPKIAEATECAAELGGNEKFWQYLDKVVVTTSITAQNLTTQLVTIAGEINLNKANFQQCLESNKYSQKISDSIQEATALGIQGTPFSAIIKQGKIVGNIPGALLYEQIKQTIEQVLNSPTS